MAKKEICIIGCGRFGTELIYQLQKSNFYIIAIDTKKENIDRVKKLVNLAIIGDATNEEFLKDNGIHKIDDVVIGIGSDIQSSLIVTTILNELKIKNIVAKAINNRHERIVKQLGVTKIIRPEHVAAFKLATELKNPIFNSLKSFDIEILDENFGIGKVAIQHKDFYDKPIKDLGLPNNKVSIVVIESKGIKRIPYGDLMVHKNDILQIFGEITIVQKIIKLLSIDTSKENVKNRESKKLIK